MVFTMTVYAVGRKTLVQGKSLRGETWEETLLRLHRTTLAPDEPLRRIVYMTYHTAQTGSPSNMVLLGHGASLADEITDAPLLIKTAPPQF